jgi:hypothetical protein
MRSRHLLTDALAGWPQAKKCTSGVREFGTFSHQPDAIDAWAHALHQRFG